MADDVISKVGRPESRGLPILQKTYDLTACLFPHTARFPKSHRFSLGVRLETTCLDVLEHLSAARDPRRRAEHLRAIDGLLARLRLLLRLGMEVKCLSFSSYEHAVGRLDEIGRMLGGWLKRVEGPSSVGTA